MQEKAKSNSVVTSTWNLVTGILTIVVIGVKDSIVANCREWAGPAAYDALTDNGKQALLHGFNQRLSNRAAIGRDKVTGQSASPAEKAAVIIALRDHYNSGGGWELAGGGLPPLNRPALYQAVAFVRGYKVETVEATYRDKTDEVCRTLLTIPAIAGKYTELSRAVSAPTDEKAKEMFAELEAMAKLEAATNPDTTVTSEAAPQVEEPKTEKKNKGFRSQS